MHLDAPNKLPEILENHYRCVWPGVVMIIHNSFSIDKIWPLPGDSKSPNLDVDCIVVPAHDCFLSGF